MPLNMGTMVRSSFALAIGATLAAGLSAAPPAFGQEDTDQRFGSRSFRDLVQRDGAAAVRPRHAIPAFVLVSAVARRFSRRRSRPIPTCAIAYWGIALSLLNNPHVPPPAENLAAGPRRHRRRARRSVPRPQRERDYHRCARRVLYRSRQGPRMARACRPISRRWRRWRSAIRTTTKRRSSTRSRSTSRPHRTTRPTPTSSKARPSWSRSSSASRGIRASRTT